jgi:hypothetical protein
MSISPKNQNFSKKQEIVPDDLVFTKQFIPASFPLLKGVHQVFPEAPYEYSALHFIFGGGCLSPVSTPAGSSGYSSAPLPLSHIFFISIS